jgi:Family of unknown function (DUF6529)
MAAPTVTHRGISREAKLLLVLLAGAAVSLALGVYGDAHDPTLEQPYSLFFTSTLQLKVWFATVAVALAVVQILLAARLYGKVQWPRQAPSWLGDAHRLTGTLAFLLTLPVAYQCLWALGFQSGDTRVLLHSLFGCFFYGVFTVKVLSVRVSGLPDPMLPIVGGLVFAGFVGVWVTSSGWFLTSRPAGIPLF